MAIDLTTRPNTLRDHLEAADAPTEAQYQRALAEMARRRKLRRQSDQAPDRPLSPGGQIAMRAHTRTAPDALELVDLTDDELHARIDDAYRRREHLQGYPRRGPRTVALIRFYSTKLYTLYDEAERRRQMESDLTDTETF